MSALAHGRQALAPRSRARSVGLLVLLGVLAVIVGLLGMHVVAADSIRAFAETASSSAPAGVDDALNQHVVNTENAGCASACCGSEDDVAAVTCVIAQTGIVLAVGDPPVEATITAGVAPKSQARIEPTRVQPPPAPNLHELSISRT